MSRSKIIFTALSLATIASSVFVYLGQKTPRPVAESNETSTKARLSGFEFFRYDGDRQKARFSGRRASLLDPSRILCEDHIVAVRLTKGLREELQADRASLILTGESLLTQSSVELEKMELEGAVEFVSGRNHFTTEWLSYTEKSGEAFSDRPVRVESGGQFVAAEGGMTYNLRDQSIRLRGGVFGSVRSDAVKVGLGGKSSQ